MISVLLEVGYLTQIYERALVLNKESLDMICASSVGEEQAACFEKVYYSVRFISK